MATSAYAQCVMTDYDTSRAPITWTQDTPGIVSKITAVIGVILSAYGLNKNKVAKGAQAIKNKIKAPDH